MDEIGVVKIVNSVSYNR